jgi:hypothetical protein
MEKKYLRLCRLEQADVVENSENFLRKSYEKISNSRRTLRLVYASDSAVRLCAFKNAQESRILRLLDTRGEKLLSMISNFSEV